MNKFFLESERLIIRPLEESDYDSWYTSFMNRGPSLT
ncbi:N-acetyltransferase, partial [Streptococcus agalactiae]